MQRQEVEIDISPTCKDLLKLYYNTSAGLAWSASLFLIFAYKCWRFIQFGDGNIILSGGIFIAVLFLPFLFFKARSGSAKRKMIISENGLQILEKHYSQFYSWHYFNEFRKTRNEFILLNKKRYKVIVPLRKLGPDEQIMVEQYAARFISDSKPQVIDRSKYFSRPTNLKDFELKEQYCFFHSRICVYYYLTAIMVVTLIYQWCRQKGFNADDTAFLLVLFSLFFGLCLPGIWFRIKARVNSDLVEKSDIKHFTVTNEGIQSYSRDPQGAKCVFYKIRGMSVKESKNYFLFRLKGKIVLMISKVRLPREQSDKIQKWTKSSDF
jgi:hypothetical protein